ncbi:flavodoxin family protein [Peribacillus alkalitolerans]|uniref:flavodoxin family protein n=1 Tax=Peribacillus alkalitolerans TaxID=1550385 RepID=UPI0013D66318|nr:flavodoxin family protein [Peribacillus alkalitolerans]
MKILALLGSSRKKGNTEYMVNRVLEGVEHTSIELAELNVLPIVDRRHTVEGFSFVDDDYEKILPQLLQHDIIIFATPLYWYGMSGHMKTFFDRWSQYLRDERFDLKGELSKKKAYVIVTGGANAPITALPLIQQFQYIFDFVDMKFEDYIIARGVKPEEVSQDQLALQKAQHWNNVFKNV